LQLRLHLLQKQPRRLEDILKRLGQRIRQIRVSRGFTSQEALAGFLKMHRTFIGHLETGRKDFRVTTLIRVAAALDVSLSDLFADVDTAERPKGARHAKGSAGQFALLKEISVLEDSVRRLKGLVRPAKVKRP